jgi:hypothetical protein
LRQGEVPFRWLPVAGLETPPPPLDAIIDRYEAAVKAGDDRYVAEVEARPIDDAAWQKELERRRWLEARRAVRVT